MKDLEEPAMNQCYMELYAFLESNIYGKSSSSSLVSIPEELRTYLPNVTFYQVAQGIQRTYATGAACQQETLTPLDTLSCLTFGLACVLMLRPISHELVLFPNV